MGREDPETALPPGPPKRPQDPRGPWLPLLLAATAVLAALLFYGHPSRHAPRSFYHLWDLGHVVLFFAGSASALLLWPRLRDLGARALAAQVVLPAAALGVFSELAQGQFHRTPDPGDLGRDLLGVALALALLSASLRRARPNLQLLAWGGVCGAVLLQLSPLALAGADELSAHLAFPTLGDFENPLELGRWGGSAELSLDPRVARSGWRSLRARLGTQTYASVALRHFDGDWRGYRSLRFSLYNPDPEPLDLICRIHDQAHEQRGFVSNDRFRRQLTADPGWTDVEIPLDDVRLAPLERELDLGRVVGFMLFAHRLPAPRVLHLDALQLEP